MNYPPRETLLADGSGTTVQTWISLTAVIVSLITAISASYWNHRTLTQTEKRFGQDRRDKRNEAIRSAVVDVVHQSLLWNPTTLEVVHSVGRVMHYMTSSDEDEKSRFLPEREDFIQRRSNWEARTSDLKRAIIAAELVVTDPETKKHLKNVLDAVDERREMVLQMIAASDSKDDAMPVLRQILQNPTPLGKYTDELIRQAQKALQDREAI
ncbi:hypothetical protein ACWDXV_30545 [Nocardia nova]